MFGWKFFPAYISVCLDTLTDLQYKCQITKSNIDSRLSPAREKLKTNHAIIWTPEKQEYALWANTHNTDRQ